MTNGTMTDMMQAFYGVQRMRATPPYNMTLFPIHFIVNVLAPQHVPYIAKDLIDSL
jgi:hypothetical protein